MIIATELVQGSWSGLDAGDRVGVATGEAIVFAAGMANISFPLIYTHKILELTCCYWIKN